MSDEKSQMLLTLTADVVVAHVANNVVSVGDVPNLIQKVHGALSGLGGSKEPEPVVQEPAVPIRASIKPDYVVCLEDGKKLKMLKRHLMTHYQMTPADYRTKWKLPADYPMVAPNYAAQRKELAVKIGLGRKRVAVAEPLPAKPARAAKAGAVKAPAKPRGRKPATPAE